MNMDYTLIISLASVFSSSAILVSAIIACYRWINRQNDQDRDIKNTKEEQALLVYGVITCLKVLKEQHDNMQLEDALTKIESYINTKAHKH